MRNFVRPRALARVVSLAAAGLIIAAGLTAAPAIAATPARPPDLNGIWVSADSFMDKQDGTSPSAPGRFNPDRPRGNLDIGDPKLKGEYAKRLAAARASEAKGVPVEDLTANCVPQGMPRFWGGPYAFEFIQTPKQINLYQEWNEQTRRIYLDGRKHPSLDDVDPLYNGHSVGHWEGDTLVVDTTNLVPDTQLSGAGSAHSDKLHITERIHLIGPDLLEVKMSVDDPLALDEPWVTTRKLRRKSGMEIQDYVCTQNNRNVTDANGVTQAILKPK